MDTRMNTFFVSEKISKIRWLPDNLQASERFLTGSWDMPSNFVRLWRLQQNQYADDYNEFVPRCSDKQTFNSDITGIEFITNDSAVVSSANGKKIFFYLIIIISFPLTKLLPSRSHYSTGS